MSSPEASRVGTMLRGKWRIERLLGHGGMASVYLGVHRIGRRDAIKVLHPELAHSAEFRARFEQEARAANVFRHPGAVEIRDVDVTDDGLPFLVMEVVEGESVASLSRRGALGLDQVVQLADELLDVLAAAHAHGLVHRDIKPENLMMTPEGRLKVLDFGIARLRFGSELRTEAGVMLGTVPYMSPEQLRGEDLDGRSDLFAVGALLYRLLARKRLHTADSEVELILRMATEQAAPLARVAPEVPAALCTAVDRALSLDRTLRPENADIMRLELRAAWPPPAVQAHMQASPGLAYPAQYYPPAVHQANAYHANAYHANAYHANAYHANAYAAAAQRKGSLVVCILLSVFALPPLIFGILLVAVLADESSGGGSKEIDFNVGVAMAVICLLAAVIMLALAVLVRPRRG